MTRFDKIELTYQNGAGMANLTAVDFYAIPFMLQTFIESVPLDQFSLLAGNTGNHLQAAMLAVATNSNDAQIMNGDNFVRILSPVKAPAAYPSMAPYVSSFVTSAASLQIDGEFYGSPAAVYQYTSKVDANNITLTMTGKSTITIPVSTLDSSDGSAIYTCNGAYYLNGDLNTPHHVSDNDLYAAVYRDVVAAFNFGYVGGKDGDSSSGWWGLPPFAAANQYYNEYAATIYAGYPGAYGFPFADRDLPVLADLGNGVDTLAITVLADNAVPTYLTVPGVRNPQTGVVNFNMVPVFANDIQDMTIMVGGHACKAGWVNNYLTGPVTNLGTGENAQINNCPAQEGWNTYDFLIGGQKYLVVVQVTNSVVTQATIAGGSNATWTSPNLFIGDLATFG